MGRTEVQSWHRTRDDAPVAALLPDPWLPAPCACPGGGPSWAGRPRDGTAMRGADGVRAGTRGGRREGVLGSLSRHRAGVPRSVAKRGLREQKLSTLKKGELGLRCVRHTVLDGVRTADRGHYTAGAAVAVLRPRRPAEHVMEGAGSGIPRGNGPLWTSHPRLRQTQGRGAFFFVEGQKPEKNVGGGPDGPAGSPAARHRLPGGESKPTVRASGGDRTRSLFFFGPGRRGGHIRTGDGRTMVV